MRGRASSRHCEPTGRANARPMTGSTKQSIAPQAEPWIASVASLLAMTSCCLTVESTMKHWHLHHLQHQFHRHQHGVVAAKQPALADAAGVVDQRDVESDFRRAACAGCNDAGGDGKLRCKGFDHAAVGEACSDGRADAAANSSA